MLITESVVKKRQLNQKINYKSTVTRDWWCYKEGTGGYFNIDLQQEVIKHKKTL